MHTALKFSTTVLPGNRIELTDPLLPEGQCVEVMVADASCPSLPRYPSVLEAEYDCLTDKELHRTLTEAESIRLQEVCRIIADIDRLTLVDDIRNKQLDKIEAELEQLRIEIEALPNREDGKP